MFHAVSHRAAASLSIFLTTTMFRKISRDVKISAIRLYERNLLPLRDILDCCGFSKRTWYRIMHLWNTTGDVLPPRASLRGRVRNLDHDDLGYLLALVRQNPDYFLDELLHLLETNRFISVHYVTIHRELERAGVSSKKLKRIALEHNEERRAAFISRMARYAPEELRFLDEFSKDARSVSRRYGRARKGRRAEKKQCFVRGRRTSTEGLLTLGGVVSGTVVEGSMTKRGFLQYLELVIVSFRVLLVLIVEQESFRCPGVWHTLVC
jgi:transposase